MSDARQRGVVLFVALVAVVALALASIALLRAVNSGLLVGGNLTLKRTASAAADAGIELARDWIINPPAGVDLTASGAGGVAGGIGYYATYGEFTALTGTAWTDANSVAVPSPPPGDYQVRYVIHRLCTNPGAVDPFGCVMGTATAASTMAANHYGLPTFTGAGSVHYRITARIQGPKSTVSFVQASLY